MKERKERPSGSWMSSDKRLLLNLPWTCSSRDLPGFEGHRNEHHRRLIFSLPLFESCPSVFFSTSKSRSRERERRELLLVVLPNFTRHSGLTQDWKPEQGGQWVGWLGPFWWVDCSIHLVFRWVVFKADDDDDIISHWQEAGKNKPLSCVRFQRSSLQWENKPASDHPCFFSPSRVGFLFGGITKSPGSFMFRPCWPSANEGTSN